MKLLVLGGTGGCGRWVLKLASERRHEVLALVRDAARVEAGRDAEVIEGSVLDGRTLERSLAGVDAVLSCLGQRRHQPRNPWSRIESPRDLNERVAKSLVQLMPAAGVSRLVAISAAGVGESASRMTPINRVVFSRSNIGVAYRDLAAMESVLAASDLDWTAVRPATLTNGRPTGGSAEITWYGLLTRIARADVAAWMLDAVSAEREPGSSGAPRAVRTPMIATRGIRG